MTYSIELTADTISELRALAPENQQRLLRKIRWLSENFEALTPQPLSADLSGFFKLRAGDYRAIYSLEPEAKRITVHKVGHRRDVYS